MLRLFCSNIKQVRALHIANINFNIISSNTFLIADWNRYYFSENIYMCELKIKIMVQ